MLLIARFSKGDKVRIRSLGNRIGIIDGQAKETKGKLFYPVSIDPNQQSPYYPEDALEVFIPPKSVEQRLRDKDFSTTKDFLQTLIYKKLEKPLSDNLFTFYQSRTEFQVHQFKPVLKLLNTFKQRLLLADEVGLGKTIEAGIIMTELSARLGELSRVLVVCPSMLTSKWETELQRRFGLDFVVLKRDGIAKFLTRYGEYGEAERISAIASLQTLRANSMLERFRQVAPHFDIVVVDEAHHMRNPETLSSELGEVLSELSDAMLFLSATPLQLGTPDLFNLLSLLIPEEFSDFALFHQVIEPNEYLNDALRRLYDPRAALEILGRIERTSQRQRFEKNPFYHEAKQLLASSRELTKEQAVRLQKLLIELNCLSYVFTRTKKRDVATQFPVREARVIRVTFTPEEMDFYNAVTDFVAESFTARYGRRQGISFAVIMPQRQVASCIQAMREKLDAIISKKTIPAPSVDNGDVISPAHEVESPLKLEKRELVSVRRLLEAAKRVGTVDSKFDRFLEMLRNLQTEDPDAKILVFAFFKKTLGYLRKKLASTEFAERVALIHGDISVKERQKTISNFRHGNKIKILLSSEVAGEGLDFEFCSVIFNYDLPWNPMRVEQRIGRLDRYGQRHEKILIYNFSIADTIDGEILERLYGRINVFERYIGDLDAILGDLITEMAEDVFDTRLTYEQKLQKIDKIAENILRKQRELEEFEKECQRFIGQDEYFNQEVTKILQTKRFITADEVFFLLSFFIRKEFPKTSLLPPKSGRAGVFVLKGDDHFRRFVRQYTPLGERLSDLERKLAFDGGFPVTFSDQEACRDESLEFITIHHPIMKAVKRYYDENNTDMHNVARFSLFGSDKYEGEYLFFIYLLEKTALKKDLILIPVLVNLVSGKVHIVDELCDWFLGDLVNAEPTIDDNVTGFDNNRFEKALRDAGDYLEMIREEEERKLQRDNDTLVNNQIESVRQATTIKINKAETTIRKLLAKGKSEDDPIVRLHRGRIRNLGISRDERIQQLERKRATSVGFSLIAGGVVSIAA